jgi:hypothetical protein
MPEYPNIIPNFYSPFSFTDYKTLKKDWSNGFYTYKQTQFTNAGFKLTLIYQKKYYADMKLITDFYSSMKNSKSFTLPTTFFDRLNPENFKFVIENYKIKNWKFDPQEKMTISPFIWNRERSLHDFNIYLVTSNT